eukprot:gene12081-biopygen7549
MSFPLRPGRPTGRSGAPRCRVVRRSEAPCTKRPQSEVLGFCHFPDRVAIRGGVLARVARRCGAARRLWI